DAYAFGAEVQTVDPAATTDPIPGGTDAPITSAALSLAPGETLYYSVELALEDADGNALDAGMIAVLSLIDDDTGDSAVPPIQVRAYGPNNQLVDGFHQLLGIYATVGGTYIFELHNPSDDTINLSPISLTTYIPAKMGS